MSSSKHGRVAALARHRDPQDPALITATAEQREEALIHAVEKALEKAPPLTPEVRQRVIGLLATSGVD